MTGCRDPHHGLIHWLADHTGWTITIMTAAICLYVASFIVALHTL
jgi:hypothetical protein